MSRKKKILLGIAGAVVILILVNIITYKTPFEKISNYLEKKGYYNRENQYLFYKQASKMDLEAYQGNVRDNKKASYENLCFSLSDYSFTKSELHYDDYVESDFTPKYDYLGEVVSYSYKVNIHDLSLIFQGEYKKNKKGKWNFSCKKAYSSNHDIEVEQEAFCDKIKYEVQDFYYDALLLVDNLVIMEEIKKGKRG